MNDPEDLEPYIARQTRVLSEAEYLAQALHRNGVEFITIGIVNDEVWFTLTMQGIERVFQYHKKLEDLDTKRL